MGAPRAPRFKWRREAGHLQRKGRRPPARMTCGADGRREAGRGCANELAPRAEQYIKLNDGRRDMSAPLGPSAAWSAWGGPPLCLLQGVSALASPVACRAAGRFWERAQNGGRGRFMRPGRSFNVAGRAGAEAGRSQHALLRSHFFLAAAGGGVTSERAKERTSSPPRCAPKREPAARARRSGLPLGPMKRHEPANARAGLN